MTFNLVRRISQANQRQISYLLDAVIKRYNELYPDWEILTISLHKNKDRNEQLDQIIKVFARLKDSP